jgi:glycerol-3-phosphate responsive antiterminator
MLNFEAVERNARAVSFFVAKAINLGVKPYVFATAAVRQAKNGTDFVKRVKDLCCIDVDVVDGLLEAKLGVLGALNGQVGGIIDIGGASTEILVSDGNKIEFIKSLFEEELREALSQVVDNVDSLIPQNEAEFIELQKFGLYPVEQCVPFVTKQGTPFYQLDNMAMVPKGETSSNLHYGDFEFRQLEVLYIMARMDSAEAHHWLKNNLFQGCRVDARKKMEYKSKFKEYHRKDWKEIQTEWMNYCLMLKYRDNALFRKDLFACRGKLPVEDANGGNCRAIPQ